MPIDKVLRCSSDFRPDGAAASSETCARRQHSGTHSTSPQLKIFTALLVVFAWVCKMDFSKDRLLWHHYVGCDQCSICLQSFEACINCFVYLLFTVLFWWFAAWCAWAHNISTRVQHRSCSASMMLRCCLIPFVITILIRCAGARRSSFLFQTQHGRQSGAYIANCVSMCVHATGCVGGQIGYAGLCKEALKYSYHVVGATCRRSLRVGMKCCMDDG